MSDLLAGLLAALAATNTPLAVSNLVKEKTGVSLPVTNPNDPATREYRRILEDDDAAVAEINRWREEQAQNAGGADVVTTGLLNNRIRQRAEPVRKAYGHFLENHPRHTEARVALAAFLEEIGEEEAAGDQLKKAVDLDATSPVALNNLANHYGHFGGVTNAFALYERAIRLAPSEPLYRENLATTVFLFRRDAMQHYRITEPEVFSRAIGLYREALALDPENFDRAVELAKTFYGVRLPPIADSATKRDAEVKLGEAALAAWEQARKIAGNDAEREGIRLHFARWQINLGRFDEARQNLNAVTNGTFASGKATLLKKLESRATATTANNTNRAPETPKP